MKIGLALSGGGVRAAVFHCGVLQRLALDGLLEETTFVSTVSGGSLIIGLILSENSLRWPGSDEFLNGVLPRVRARLTKVDLQRSYARRVYFFPWRLARGRAHILARRLEAQWEIHGSLQDLPDIPRWTINATCYETGRNWRFIKSRMGDYLTQYVKFPEIPIADAMAASAAVPGLIGPLTIRSRDYDWYEFEEDQLVPTSARLKRYHLWDGGVYDNLGVESLFKPGGGFREGFDFLLVSDASAPLLWQTPKTCRRFLRLVNIAKDQVRGLRARSLISEYQETSDCGVYLRMGNTVDKIFTAAGQKPPSGRKLARSDVKQATQFETTLKRIGCEEFDMLLLHGFEVANATLATRQSTTFDYKDSLLFQSRLCLR